MGQLNFLDSYLLCDVEILASDSIFNDGEQVEIIFYDDELDYIKRADPGLLLPGVVIGVKYDFYIVNINDKVMKIERRKLKRSCIN